MAIDETTGLPSPREQFTKEEVSTAAEDLIRAYLGSYSRDPFQRILAKFLSCGPSRDDITTFSKRNPDKWVKALHQLAAMSGYVEKHEIETNINVTLMSDAEVENKLREITEQLAAGEKLVVLDKIEFMPASQSEAASQGEEEPLKPAS